ncbi:MAG: response regulator [Bdellovibrionota bacterium]
MTNKQKILIVDDEPRNQRIVSEVLEGLVEFKVASSGEEALQVIAAYLPDLVLLDIMMPGIDGYEVCKKIKTDPKLNLMKVLLVSGKAMLEEKLKGYDVGADDYITKPFVPEELLAKAKAFLRLAFIERELMELNQSLDQQVQSRTRQLLDAEAKLVSVAKMSALGEMAGGVAHEINTPLGVISVLAEQLAELLNETPLDKGELSRMTKTIGDTVRRISAIIQSLRTFSDGVEQAQFTPVSVSKIIEDTLLLCREKMRFNEIDVVIDPIADELVVQCQPVQVSRVILNLLNNSFDAVASLPEKWIKIAAEKQADHVQVSITDSGKGIPEAIQSKLFQPFFTTKEIGKGTGLGLSISKGIIDSHGGSISVDPASKNTRFLLKLPFGKTHKG